MKSWMRRLILSGAVLLIPLGMPWAFRDLQDADFMNRLMQMTERIRELRFRHRLRTQTLTETTLQRLLQQAYHEDKARFQSMEKILQLLGLLSPGQRLWSMLAPLYQEQVAGIYDPKTRTLFLRPHIGETAGEAVIVHELSHALVDQHFDLKAYLHDPAVREDSEAALARQAVAEGDALLVMMAYQMKAMGIETPLDTIAQMDPAMLDQLFRWLTAIGSTGDMPAWLLRMFVAPYMDGLRLVLAAYRRDGWAGVNALYQKPPQTTAQLLHPDRYFKNRPGRTLKRRGSWNGRVAAQEVIGELGCRVWLGAFVRIGRARQACEGWEGDGAVLVQDAEGLWILDVIFEWTTERDAQEFAHAAQDAFQKRKELSDVMPVQWRVTQKGRRVQVIVRGMVPPSSVVPRSLIDPTADGLNLNR